MMIEVDNYPEENKVEVSVIHACVILDNGLPYYQKDKSTFNNARLVNGNSGTMAIVKSDAFESGATEIKNEQIIMVFPIQMTILRNHYPEKKTSTAHDVDALFDHPF